MYSTSREASGEYRCTASRMFGVAFLHLHAEALHVVGQARQRILHAVLRQHLRDVEVGADAEQ